MGGDMKKERKKRYSLGDHIVALFEEANQLSLQPVEQKVMVYAALKHLLKNTSAVSIQLPCTLNTTNTWGHKKNVDWEIATERYHSAKQTVSVVAQVSETQGSLKCRE